MAAPQHRLQARELALVPELDTTCRSLPRPLRGGVGGLRVSIPSMGYRMHSALQPRPLHGRAPDQTPTAPVCSAVPQGASRVDLWWGPGFHGPIKNAWSGSQDKAGLGHTSMGAREDLGPCAEATHTSPGPGRRGRTQREGYTQFCAASPQYLTCSCPSWSAAP